MLEESRQIKLDVVLKALSVLPNCTVQSDDWDSAGVNVFVYMDKNALNAKPYNFLRSTKATIKKALKGYSWNWLDWPSMKYDTSTFWGTTEKFALGYDRSSIKIEVYI